MIGQQIRTIDHAINWCVKGHQRIAIKCKDGSFAEHSFNVLAIMPLKTVLKKLDQGSIYEVHRNEHPH